MPIRRRHVGWFEKILRRSGEHLQGNMCVLGTLLSKWTRRRQGAYTGASPDEQKKLQLLLSLRLQELTSTEGKSLRTAMDEIGQAAEARGLTPEVLETLLRDE